MNKKTFIVNERKQNEINRIQKGDMDMDTTNSFPLNVQYSINHVFQFSFMEH